MCTWFETGLLMSCKENAKGMISVSFGWGWVQHLCYGSWHPSILSLLATKVWRCSTIEVING